MVLEGLPKKAVFERSGSGGVSPGESWGKSILGSRNSTAKAGVGVRGAEEGVERVHACVFRRLEWPGVE